MPSEPGLRTLDAKLRAFYAEHDEAHPCELSIAELARMFAPGCKPANGEREIRRANRRIGRTHRPHGQLHERVQYRGACPIQTARWWTKKDPGWDGRSDLSSSSVVDLRPEQLDLEANADRARARPLASRSTPRVQTRTKKAREVRGSPVTAPRRRAVPHGVRNPELLVEVAPVALAGLGAVKVRHPGCFDALTEELRRPRYHEHPVEACRAVRTLAVRDTDTPVRLFRHLYRAALDGDLLVDDDTEAVVEAELEARAVYAWDPDNPLTHWTSELVVEGEELTAEQLEDRRLARERRELERIEAHRAARERRELERIELEAIARTMPPRPTDPAIGAAFLAALEERKRNREICG